MTVVAATAVWQPKKPVPSGAGFLSAAILAAIAITPLGVASAQVRDAGDYLRRMDADADGRVSLAEYQQWMGYAFDRMDVDDNDVLDPAELPGGRGRPVTRSQHRAAIAAAFDRQDSNGDGVLDARELAAPPQ